MMHCCDMETENERTTMNIKKLKEVAQTVSLRRPDLARGDAIATVLTQDPTLTADQVIEMLDESAEENRAAKE